MTFVLGLTGGIASGKSTADNFFRKKEIPVIDSDQIAHDLLNVGQASWRAVKDNFDGRFLNNDKTINRQKLGQLVFNNASELNKLNQLTHPLIYQEIQIKITAEKKKKTPLIVVDTPLLFETSNGANYDGVLVLTLPQKTQLKRLMERNQLTRQEALARISSQMPLSQKEQKADYIISNTGTVAELETKLARFLKQIKQEN